MKNQATTMPAWGAGYFGIDSISGKVMCCPTAAKQSSVCLQDIVQNIIADGYRPPFMLCFPQIIASQLQRLEEAFSAAQHEFSYPRRHYGVFPLKVNQHKNFVQALLKYGQRYDYGLEVGSKAELVIALGSPLPPAALLVCNGFKDEEFIELICLAATKHRNVLAVIESLAELSPLCSVLRQHQRLPQLGFRIRLSHYCASRWDDHAGLTAKFGLTAFELLELLQTLQKYDLTAQVKMLHFHAGSQITEISTFKRSLKEAARIYAKVVKMGFPLQYLNIGGGLGVDYEGSKTSSPFNTNYEPQEFINDAVYVIASICKEEGAPAPFIVSESGRVIAAYHSLVVTDARKAHALGHAEMPTPTVTQSSKPLRELNFLNTNLNATTCSEYYHDAIEHYRDLLKLFNLGFISLAERATGEKIYRQICTQAYELMQDEPQLTAEFKQLQHKLASKYLANFSVFQSLPDAWAIGQRFPVLPLSRPPQATTDKAHIVDITCDSDGCLSQFTDSDCLELQTLEKNSTCYLGFFLTGAYQASLGNNHNLFGTAHRVEVTVNDDNYSIAVVAGNMVNDLLRHHGYEREQLVAEFSKQLTADAPQALVASYQKFLTAYPYLNLSSTDEC